MTAEGNATVIPLMLDAGGETYGSFEERQFYWTASCVVLWIDTVLLGKLMYEYFWDPRSNLRKPFFIPFRLLILGDIVYVVLTYLPYHTYNTIASRLNPDFAINDEAVCKIWAWLFLLGITLSVYSAVLIWYFTYQMIRSLVEVKSIGDIHAKGIKVINKGGVACILVPTVAWAFSFWTDGIGSFRGLYCGIAMSNKGGPLFSGLFVLGLVCISSSLMAYYFYHSVKALRMLVETSQKTRDMDTDERSQRLEHKLLKSIQNIGIMCTVSYFSCWGPATMYLTLRVLFGVELPIELAIFISFLVKCQSLCDVLLIITSAPYKRIDGRSKKGSSTKPSALNSHKHNKIMPTSTRGTNQVSSVQSSEAPSVIST